MAKSPGVSWLRRFDDDETIIGMARICEVEGCDRAGRLTRGMCVKHYRYWLDHTPPAERGTPPSRQRDFDAFVSKRHEQGCWTWTGPRHRQGYGLWGKKLAHRQSWERANGPIPEGFWILHHCDNPPCVNPAHLYAGTRAENAQDVIDRGRAYRRPPTAFCPSGHAKTGDNLLIVVSKGQTTRRCLTCERARKRVYERRRRARIRAERAARGDR